VFDIAPKWEKYWAQEIRRHGMRIKFAMVLLSTRDFGDWTQYLPRDPGFM
jgi:hypothetical protein